MTAPEVMTVHPTDETLAGFIDDRLKANERRAVTRHLADCDECRTFLNDLSDIKAMDEADNVVEMPKRGGWRVAAASFAVAAGLLVVFATDIRDWTYGRSMNDLKAASAEGETRPVEGRLSLDLPYKKAVSVNRGSEEKPSGLDPTVPSELYKAVSVLSEARWAGPHRRGVALLMAHYYQDAILELRKAAEADGAAVPDLAAALIASGSRKELQEAARLSEGSRTPTALWNRAYALYKLNDPRAAQAWKDYLAVDSKSTWADEAREKLANLTD